MHKFILFLLLVASGPATAQVIFKSFSELERFRDTSDDIDVSLSTLTLKKDTLLDIRDSQDKKLSIENFNIYTPFRIESIFEKQVSIWTCNFYDRVEFSKSEFADTLELRNVTFQKAPLFEAVVLPNVIVLENVTIDASSKVDFTSCSVEEGKCLLRLINMRAAKLIVPHQLFALDMTIKENNYEDILLSFIDNCKSAGLSKSAQEWEIELKKFKNLQEYPVIGRTLNYVNEIWWNFGFDKGLIFWKWLPITFCVFLVINIIFLPVLLGNYQDKEVHGAFDKTNQNLTAVIKKHRVMYALVYTAVIYFNFKLTLSAMNFKKELVVAYIFFMYSIGNLHVIIGVGGYLLSFQNS